MTHAEYSVGICYWTTVYRQFNDKLNVVLTIYSFLIYTNSMVALTYGILKAKVARFDSPPRSINFRKRKLWDCQTPVPISSHPLTTLCLQHGNRQEPSNTCSKVKSVPSVHLLEGSTLVCIIMGQVQQGSTLNHTCTVAIIIQSNINRGKGNTICYLVSKIILITCLQLILHQNTFVHSC